jgi:hypothetical protein
MRRTLATHHQRHGTLKDTQGALRHASIITTGNVYVQTIESSVLNAMNSRTMEILATGARPFWDGNALAIHAAAPTEKRKAPNAVGPSSLLEESVNV